MGLNWSTVKPEHVTRACEMLIAGEHATRVKAKGLFVVFREKSLPAKQVIRLAYCLANNMSLDSNVKFASGEATLNLLRGFGFSVKRQPGLAT